MLVILLLSIVGGAGGFYFSNNILANNSKELVTAEKELKSADSQLTYLQELEGKTEEAKATLGSIDAIFPNEKRQAEFIAQLRQRAAIRGVDIGNQISFSGASEKPSEVSLLAPSEVNPGIVGIELVLPVNGPFDNVMAFIDDVEEFRRLVNIEEITISSVDGVNLTSTITMQVLVDQSLSSGDEEGAEDGGPSEEELTQ